jgi:periplasmic protein TonB
VLKTLDDILFENRNKEYGSYRIRKQYFRRLFISFAIALMVMIALSLSYFWYLNTDVDNTIYYLPSYGSSLRSTEASFFDPGELQAYLQGSSLPRDQEAVTEIGHAVDPLHNFTISENVTSDTLITYDEEIDLPEIGSGSGLSDDSTVFGGYLFGDGQGTGFGRGVDRIPEFPLGNATRYVEMNLKYPAQAIKQNINGVVIVSFMISKTGEVVDVTVQQSVDPIIDKEAVKTIQGMPRWKPAMRHGKPVNFRYLIRVNFMPIS